MRIGLVSGDGLPVSGLLTTFRNVIALGIAEGLVEPPVPADLGYSWRPDKGEFYPRGDGVRGYPDWLRVADSSTAVLDTVDGRREWLDIRAAVAEPERLTERERARLRERIGVLAAGYRRWFADWLADNEIDWVIAVNMTLSDAVPVTLGLRAAVADRYTAPGRPGGLVYWDHDLFGSCAVIEGGRRVYPPRPNEFTPLPAADGHTRWAVVSEPLRAETAGYPTAARASVVSNILPVGADRPITERHREFAAQRGLRPDSPLILCPVRVFRVKGVELSIRLLAATADECAARGLARPQLLVFGSLHEDAGYAAELLALVAELGVGADVVFLDGVPLGSYRDDAGTWSLDEVDLLRLAAATGGIVFFTPNTPDVETVGLGPALASLAGLPSVTTPFTAFDQVYGPAFHTLRVGTTEEELRSAAPEVVRALHDPAARHRAGGNGANTALLNHRFPRGDWLALLRTLHAHCTLNPHRDPDVRSAVGSAAGGRVVAG